MHPLILQMSSECRIVCHRGYKVERLAGAKWKTLGYHSTLENAVTSIVASHPALLVGGDQTLDPLKFLQVVEEQTASLLHLLKQVEASSSGS